MKAKLIIEEEELTKLRELNKNMNETPVMLLFGKHDLHEDAKQRVVDYWDELGNKYDFDPKNVKGIDTKTGEIKI